MRYAILENNTVTNIAESDFPLDSNWIADDGKAQIGGTWDGQFHPPVPKPLTQADFEQALTDHLDKTAQAKHYDNRITCMVRAGFPGPFQAEGVAFAAWADGCNALAYQWLAEIEAGTKPVFASTSDFLDALPVMVWPT